MSRVQIPPACNAFPRNFPGKTLGTELMQSRQVFNRNRVIFYHRSKQNNWAMKWYSEQPFTGCFPIRREILNVSQVAIAFHGICPPIFIQTRLQQCSRGAFFHSAHCSLSNHLFPICVVSTYNDSRKDLHRLCQIPKNCQCK